MIQDASNLAISGFIFIVLSLSLLILGYVSILRQNYKQHKNFMGLAITSNTIFLILYIYRLLTEGNTVFKGSDFIYSYIYIPILVVHIFTAIISVYFVGKQFFSGYLGRQTINNKLVLSNKYRAIHKSNARKAIIIWFFSFLGGITTFILLYIIP